MKVTRVFVSREESHSHTEGIALELVQALASLRKYDVFLELHTDWSGHLREMKRGALGEYDDYVASFGNGYEFLELVKAFLEEREEARGATV